MTRSAAGTIDESGRNVKQKSGLNREILNIGWAQVTRRTQEKGKQRGCQVARVEARNTSITCPCCDHVDTANRVTRDKFVCQKCGFVGHADVVAASNVKNKALVEGRVEAPASRKLDSADRITVAARPELTPWNPASEKPGRSGEVAQLGSSVKREQEKGNRTVGAALVDGTRPNIAKPVIMTDYA